VALERVVSFSKGRGKGGTAEEVFRHTPVPALELELPTTYPDDGLLRGLPHPNPLFAREHLVAAIVGSKELSDLHTHVRKRQRRPCGTGHRRRSLTLGKLLRAIFGAEIGLGKTGKPRTAGSARTKGGEGARGTGVGTSALAGGSGGASGGSKLRCTEWWSPKRKAHRSARESSRRSWTSLFRGWMILSRECRHRVVA
jgi:hypothetical protein